MTRVRRDAREDILIVTAPGAAASIRRQHSDRDGLTGQLRANPCGRIRRALVEAPAADPNGFERIVGRSDLVSINFLSLGLKAA